MSIPSRAQSINTFRPRQVGCHFADDICKSIFLHKDYCILIEIPLQFVPSGSNWQWVIIVSDNGLALNMRTNAGLVYWRINVSLGFEHGLHRSSNKLKLSCQKQVVKLSDMITTSTQRSIGFEWVTLYMHIVLRKQIDLHFLSFLYVKMVQKIDIPPHRKPETQTNSLWCLHTERSTKWMTCYWSPVTSHSLWWPFWFESWPVNPPFVFRTARGRPHDMEMLPHHWPFVRGINWSTVDSLHKWPATWTSDLLSTWISCWTNSGVAGDLRFHDAFIHHCYEDEDIKQH